MDKIHETVEEILNQFKVMHHNINSIDTKTYLQRSEMERLKKIIRPLEKALKFLHEKYFYKDLNPNQISLAKTISNEVINIGKHLEHLHSITSSDDKNNFHNFKESFNVFYRKFHVMLVNIEKLKELIKHDFDKEKVAKEHNFSHPNSAPNQNNHQNRYLHHTNNSKVVPIKKEETEHQEYDKAA